MKLVTRSDLVGEFVADEAPGALPNGTKIVKTMSDPEDITPTGMTGIVLGSITIPAQVHEALIAKGKTVPEPRPDFFYFVVWDDKKNMAIGCLSHKLRLAEEVH